MFRYDAVVLVVNLKFQFLPEKAKQFGLNYEALKRINPGLIVCSLTG
jgi:crotonobetainyl-CoA:carnitine CoA-transferase CaiB-like acyl-CoA transferase